MTAYFVAVRTTTTDHESMATYRELAAAARDGHPMTVLAAYGRIQPADGPAADGAVILAFPTFEDAETWYNSDAYQKALPHRLKGGEYQTFIVQGID